MISYVRSRLVDPFFLSWGGFTSVGPSFSRAVLLWISCLDHMIQPTTSCRSNRFTGACFRRLAKTRPSMASPILTKPRLATLCEFLHLSLSRNGRRKCQLPVLACACCKHSRESINTSSLPLSAIRSASWERPEKIWRTCFVALRRSLGLTC